MHVFLVPGFRVPIFPCFLPSNHWGVVFACVFFLFPPGFLVQTTGVNKASGESSPSAIRVDRSAPRRT